MNVHRDSYEFETEGRFDVVDLTGWAEGAVEESGVEEGIALIYAGHATGVIVLNESDEALIEDLKGFLDGLIPPGGRYHHPRNAPSHLASMLLTPSRVIPVCGGRLGLGTWQSLYWIEVERTPRQRRVEVTVMGV